MQLTITNIIAIVTVIASIYAWSNQNVMNKWIFNPYSIDRYKEYHRFLTAGFIHADYLHLAFNMLALYSFGNMVEYQYIGRMNNGTVLYIALYFAGMLASHLPAYFQHRNHSYYNALGASGAVSAVVFAGILFSPTSTILVLFIPMPGFIFGALYLFYSYYQGRRGNDNIGHDAHFFGAIFGILFTIAVYPPVLEMFTEAIRHFRFRLF